MTDWLLVDSTWRYGWFLYRRAVAVYRDLVGRPVP